MSVVQSLANMEKPKLLIVCIGSDYPNPKLEIAWNKESFEHDLRLAIQTDISPVFDKIVKQHAAEIVQQRLVDTVRDRFQKTYDSSSWAWKSQVELSFVEQCMWANG